MTVWDDLLNTALVGTERRPFDLAAVSELAGTAALDVARVEARVLTAAALVATCRRAGRLPDRMTGAVPPAAQADDRPLCSDTAQQILSLLLSGMVEGAGGNDELVGEWLHACAAQGQRVPAPMLVPLLSLGTARSPLRAAVAAVAGPRGAWLAARNPDWSWLLPPAAADVEVGRDLADRYATASRDERVALLRAVRSCDREAARGLLLSTWKAEPAAGRAALLAALEPDIGDDDEPLLEDVLDDRAGSVRSVAADLLGRLPRSRRAERMAERAGRLVDVEGRFRRKLVVELPDALDAAARRDGITDERTTGTGLKASWLVQIVAAAPLDMWPPHLSVDPEEAVRLASDHPELRDGWTRAAVSQRNQVWAAALLARAPDTRLVALLPPSAAADYLDGVVQKSSVPDALVVAVLSEVPGPWPVALSGRVVARLVKAPRVAVATALPTLSARLDPSVLPAVESWIDRVGDEPLRREIRNLAHALSLRQTINQEFA